MRRREGGPPRAGPRQGHDCDDGGVVAVAAPGTPGACGGNVAKAGRILAEYDLCDHCLGRLFTRRAQRGRAGGGGGGSGSGSSRLAGRRLRKSLGSAAAAAGAGRGGGGVGGTARPSPPTSPPRTAGGCYICKGLLAGLDGLLDKMTSASSAHDFDTFGVGAVVRHSTADRDDHVRSRYRLRGAGSVKADITRELARRFSAATGKAVDHRDPDIVFTVSLRDMSCSLRSKAATFYGRYTKSARGIPQRREPCAECGGGGCGACGFHGSSGSESVEGIISGRLFEEVGGTAAKFTWIGGEDRSSLVTGTGRPFFASVQNPLRRRLRRQPPPAPAAGGSAAPAAAPPVRILGLRAVPGRPRGPVRFTSLIRIDVSAGPPGVSSQSLRGLKALQKAPVVVYDRTARRAQKRILSARYRKRSADRFTLTIRAEGGLPVKRLVRGEDVVPGVSQILGVPCTCLRFDFLDVRIEQ